MKKLFLLGVILSFVTLVSAQNYQVKQSDYSKLTISFKTPQPEIADINLFGNDFTSFTLEGYTTQDAAGMPALPSLVKLIEVPLGDGLTYTVESITVDTIDGRELGIDRPLLPKQPSRRKSDNSPARLVKNAAAYASNNFLGDEAIRLESLGIARNRNIARIIFNPVKWNPSTNQLIVVKGITVTVRQTNADVAATKKMQSLYDCPAFNSGMEIINTLGAKDNHTSAPIRMTIVAHSSFKGALDDFVAWKRRKGFIVDLVYTDDANVGTTTTSIKNYLKGLYDNATATEPAPTYVLLVGDVAQVPAFQLSSYGETHYSDLSYCCWTGNDYIPDCYYGRFSAQNLNQLTPQISKTLMYEQYTFPDDSYLSTAALIAGVDQGYSSDYAYKYADPTMDYIAKTYVNASNGFTNVVYYKNNTSFAPSGVTVTGSSNSSAAATALRNLYNSGCGWVNYSAHGNDDCWGTPSFTTSNVSSMTNNNKPIVMIGNCCLTNSFQVSECLGEALLRKGNNAGAVAYIGASNSTYWDDDFYWSVGIRSNISNTCNPNYEASHLGMYDKLFHTHNEAYANWFYTLGAMIYAGNMSVESSSSSRKEYYWQIYHLMGDPSVMPYNKGRAATMTPNVPSTLTLNSTTMNIQAVPYAYIAFNDNNGHLLTAAFADANGAATLTFDPISSVGSHEVVITAQNYKPYIQPVTIITYGPYVSVTEMTPAGNLNADGNISFNIKLRNQGVDNAADLTLRFQSNSEHILLDSTGFIHLNTGLAAGQEMTLNAVCSGHIWGSVEDLTSTQIRAFVYWGNTTHDVSENNFTFTINAPKPQYVSHTINGSVASNNTTLTITNRNNGHATLQNGTISLICLDPCLTIGNSTNNISNITAGQSFSHTYNITANGTIPDNRIIPIIQVINNGYVSYKDTLNIILSQSNQVITFDDGTFGDYNWVHGNYPWEITNSGTFAGPYCIRSKTNLGNSKSSTLSITWTSAINDSITFYKKVSSETSYDFYRFFIDGVEQESLSGTANGWTRSAYYIPKGTHTFKFSYEKDYSATGGSDCAWVDNIHLPLSSDNMVYILDSTCQGSEYLFNGTAINTDNLNNGYHQFTDTVNGVVNILTLYITEVPNVTINGGDVTIRNGESVRLTATGAERYQWSSGETTAIIDVYPTETTTYTVTGYNGTCSSEASTTITVEGAVLGVSDIDNNTNVVYPNPASNSLNIEGTDISRIRIINLAGQELMNIESTSEKQTIDISSLPNGIYLIQIFDKESNSSSVHKIVKR